MQFMTNNPSPNKHVCVCVCVCVQVYDQWLDYSDVFEVRNLTALALVVKADGVDFIVRGREDGGCSLYLNVPMNGKAVEIVALTQEHVGSAWLSVKCARRKFDLCDPS